jgi:hypothetical protein
MTEQNKVVFVLSGIRNPWHSDLEVGFRHDKDGRQKTTVFVDEGEAHRALLEDYLMLHKKFHSDMERHRYGERQFLDLSVKIFPYVDDGSPAQLVGEVRAKLHRDADCDTREQLHTLIAYKL